MEGNVCISSQVSQFDALVMCSRPMRRLTLDDG